MSLSERKLTLHDADCYDVVVIGGGHAGAEAAWAAAGLGMTVALVSLDPSKIGAMSCNPAIGGLAKGQMVREIDALGGIMGRVTDATGIQFRMLNRSKGPAVWGPRAQCDKYRYAAEVQRVLSTRTNISVVAGEVAEIETSVEGVSDAPTVAAVRLSDGRRIGCRAVVVTTGTFLRALMHTGESQTEGGRVGEGSARGLSGCLQRLGLKLGRLKTGTPPRIDRGSIDFSKTTPQPGDDRPTPFAFSNEYVSAKSGSCENASLADVGSADFIPPLRQVNCYLTGTDENVHAIIRENLDRAPMYSGQIQSTGPRYCPSIEDKVVRFADKSSHQIFLEPEGLDTDEIYCNGISTSLPADVQERVIRLIPGLENARVLRWGYAVEYDMVWPSQIRNTLETKAVGGLFLAGQINGTSGYEEAAAQGLVAGTNAARLIATGRADFVLRRDQAYIGVLIDDLVTRHPVEPYRMFTSRAEHRLHLRNDNADLRLTDIGRSLGLVGDEHFAQFCRTKYALESTREQLAGLRVEGQSAVELLRRTDWDWDRFSAAAGLADVDPHLGWRVEVELKYEGYISRQNREVERMIKLEEKAIPPTFDFAMVTGLRNEARAQLTTFTPSSLGQASRIAGITPADVTVLAVAISRF